MSAIIAYIFARLREPSTYAGIGALLAGVGLKIAPDLWAGIVTAATAVAGLIAMFMPDAKPKA